MKEQPEEETTLRKGRAPHFGSLFIVRLDDLAVRLSYCSTLVHRKSSMAARSAIVRLTRHASRGYATEAGPSALIFLEHRNGKINSASLNAISAAAKLGGQVTGVVTGGPKDNVKAVAESAKSCVLSLRFLQELRLKRVLKYNTVYR